MAGSGYFRNFCLHFPLRDCHENNHEVREHSDFRRFLSALVKHISLRALPVNFDTFSMDKSQELISSELCPVQIFKSAILWSMKICCWTLH